jgi:predicted nuclease of predicted toxin-antitoxin system
MSFRFLADEDTDPSTAPELRSRGYEAVAVRDVDEPGTGTPDSEVIEYARKHDYVALTSDKGFVPTAKTRNVAIVFCQDDDLRPHEICTLIDELVEYAPTRADLPDAYYETRAPPIVEEPCITLRFGSMNRSLTTG